MLAQIDINESRCKGCGICTISCPRMLLRLGDDTNESGYNPAVITNQEKCVGCALCAGMCPDIAIEVFSRQRNEYTGNLVKAYAVR
jgi:2-oxoglutarate ferredoxin oxidoreductase subunit delta